MPPDHALADITPNDILTLRLRKDPLIDALEHKVAAVTGAVSTRKRPHPQTTPSNRSEIMTQDKTIATVPLAAFILLKPFISTEETRYYLNGVHLTPQEPCDPVTGNSVAVATAGHRLGAYGFGDGTADRADVVVPVIVSRHAIDRLVKATPRGQHGDARVVITKATDRPSEATFLVLDRTGETLAVHPMPHDGLVDGTFPQWRLVVAGARQNQGPLPEHMPLFAGPLFATLAVITREAHRLTGRTGSAHVSLQPSREAGAPAEVTLEGRQDFYGLLTPSRSQRPPHAARAA